MNRPRIAVVGAGISGLATAWLLSQQYRVTLFEANSYLGGHTNTVDVTLDGHTHPVDTGFLVFNERTYPNLCALFALLGIDSVETEMSFAVSLQQPDLEWAGTSLGTVFGQKRNLLRPAFWTMLAEILRFHRASATELADSVNGRRTLGEFLEENGYAQSFADWYLLPMAAAIWSCPPSAMLDMPLTTFLRFCDNHGLLQIFDRPQWSTVKGGGRSYVRRLAEGLDDIRLGCPVRSVRHTGPRLRVEWDGGSDTFDEVVLACHSDQAFAILGNEAGAARRALLSAVRYQRNRAVLHTDPALLPRSRKLWSAWNYVGAGASALNQPVGVSYLINKLQPLPFQTPVVVTLNPPREPDPARVLAQFDYAHPVLDRRAIAAQRHIDALQGEGGIWLAGAWSGYGFHEDGLKSALRVVNGLGVRAPWQGQLALDPRRTARAA